MANVVQAGPKEITIRGIILGIVITLVFTAAQVYLGLKVGLTFATSIPAAVISMALLSAFKDATIQENNIVQTIASAAGTLASVIFVLPGLLMIGWWAHVPFWPTFGACAIGGVLGVMYTVPLRRALVSQSDLPYPEGVAAAEVLKVGTSSRSGAAEGKLGLMAVIWGSATSALFAAAAGAKIMAAEVAVYFKTGSGATGIGAASSLALLGAGHLMGITVGIAMLVGLIIAWGVLVPVLTSIDPMPALSAADQALGAWSKQVRIIGAGAIGAAAIVTLAGLGKPVLGGLKSALETARKAKMSGAEIPRADQDLPIFIVGLVTLLAMVPAGWLMASFLQGGVLSSLALPLVIVGVGYIVVAGVFAAAVCGYMAGLIGSSNSPVSGIAILTILGASLSVGFVGKHMMGPEVAHALVAYALFVTTVVLAVAVIGNDNLQDLKTGQLVGATPWKQQVGLLIGVGAGSAVVPLVLELLNRANGFAGAPNIGVISASPLAAPQATLISTLAKGVISHNLDWKLVGYGAALGLLLVIVDFVIRKASKDRYSLPPLGVGLAIYLPSAVTAPVVVGAVTGWLFERAVENATWGETAKRIGVLIMSGFIVGESLFNVGLAGLIVATGVGEPLAIPNSMGEGTQMLIALVLGGAIVGGLYRWAARNAEKVAA
ncbi:OPT family oligopeptide transporter [Massilia antarctica]|uniref:OPT family oligopeptide transporter n=1 Tax=Massilia antarctica TaxID=2765360 RepID=UPI0006BB7EE3|nr:oligopeptide transporter, OPT family [Massilia sp. H27-R4]MCY0910363.1 oligopeptide transporter, OPT family [Massilia sp. H27-R4]CUI09295.1 oligopeptide transporter [Janthinobacterium sp. CG23_2]CUU33081.1 oligopeptide transporter [Janthinobacterium sp. CG23_2]